ncbi:D-hexose-6-phosphate mutarotase [Variovorax guangxiensis]|uniref:Putative glucose-6-phosphate 1-epimerase n=1 Tax=Variovorax guangxiensis TaxID=1775474 RepID=A0A502DSM9_9BURK|nr:D-hexose-6-phosphate mutarotase [Variovorax guangxiensis]TPG24215.1 D-hexose-6-phosphate mutarotase [Variovorax ginsengisoli]TPG28465.1 D-hexose-6-phosphate mutarotase [Variovorax guangxiensis]
MPLQTLDVRGQPAVRLTLSDGSTCTIALHGAHVLGWTTADGVERLYLSPDAVFDGQAALRGGVPVCWPQFNQRGPLAKHGFARNTAWRVEPQDRAESGEVRLTLTDSEATRAVWPHRFRVTLTATLTPQGLRMALDVLNTDASPWSFTAALHTYLRVDEIADVRLQGLQDAARWDAVRDVRHPEATQALHFGEEFDSVYAAPAAPLRLAQPLGTLEIAQSASCTETVVWNPGPVLAAKLSDLPDDGWRHMLCVEAARIDEAVLLQPGAAWQGWQQLSVR